MSSPATTTPPDPRAAAVAAAQRRLQGIASPPSSSSSPDAAAPKTLFKPWVRPTEKEERVLRIKFARLVDREIMGGNGYATAATCLETLLQITDNILKAPEDPKYRLLKDTSKVLKAKVLDCRGGKDYLIEVGFRAKRENFTLSYFLANTEANLFNLNVGREVIATSLKEAKHRAEASTSSSLANKQFEAARKEAALRAIEADRESVHDRVERERIGREARAAKAAAAAALEGVPMEVEEDEASGRVHMSGQGMTLTGQVVEAPEEEEEEDETAEDGDEDEDEDYHPADGGFAGQGNKLGE